MNDRYSRNRIYISESEQEQIRNFSILLAGTGIGSNIAECALRFGFENITLVDGDTVSISNLNRQNYSNEDISSYKSEALYKRLKSINPDANINFINKFINRDNVFEIIHGHDLVINALDFDSDIPLIFDSICQNNNIKILHPYNLGLTGVVAVITPGGSSLTSLLDGEKFNELKFVDYVVKSLKLDKKPFEWIEKIIEEYRKETIELPPPQLAIGSWILAAMCTHIMFNIVTKRKYKIFPQFYINGSVSLTV